MNVATMATARARLLGCLLLLVAFANCNPISADPSLHPHVLVLLDDLVIKSTHSMFFNSLSDRGYELHFKVASDPSLALKKHGMYLYDGLILFAPHLQSFGGSVTVANVLDFVDSGRDLIVAADPGLSDTVWDLANECGIVFDEDPNAIVVDHLNSAVTKTAKGDTIIAADSFVKSTVLLGEKGIQNPVLFYGPAHTVSYKNNMVIKVLSASPSAYSANPKAQLNALPESSGSSIGLVSVVQARNNARILISGSLALFSNRFFTSPVIIRTSSTRHEKSGNEQFANELTKWVFHEKGHLKAVNVNHHKLGDLEQPQMYRITDHLEYSLEIYEWSREGWRPYSADDVQVQFYMMSPYILKTMSHNRQGLYTAKFQVPDAYGVFQFKVEYERLGYTSLSLSNQIPVRPFRHNEYERFIQAAYPYYSSCFSMIFGFFIFSLLFLYHK